MNWLRHELRCGAWGLQFNSWSVARNHEPQVSIHDTKCQIIPKRGLTMKENFLVDLSKQFAADIVNLCTDIKENRFQIALKECYELVNFLRKRVRSKPLKLQHLWAF